MEIDEALERAKPLGRTQGLISTTAGVLAFELSWIILSVVFIAENPPHHCTVCENCTLEDSIPVQEGNPLMFEQCLEYVNSEWKNETQLCSNGWHYYTELYGDSIVSDWDLVCDKDSLPGLSQSIMLAGFAVGSILAGTAADKYGRRPVTIASILLFNIVGIAVSFSPNYATFVTLRFLLGVIFRGVQLPPLVTLIEFLIPKHRAIFGNIPSVIFSLALVIMSGIAYWIRNWRIFHVVLMVPSIVTMTFIWLQPESVRWLSSHGKHEAAEKWMQKVAKFNGVKDFPKPALKFSEKEEKNEVTQENESDDWVKDNEKVAGKKKTYILFELFRPPTFLVTCVLSWLWVTYTLLYFGFALTTGNLAGDFYLNFFLSSLVELPARIIPLFIIKRIGSLIPLITLLIASGICMIALVITDNLAVRSMQLDNYDWLVTTLSLVGKFLAVCCFPAINLLQTELFPTKVRTAGVGFSQLVGNLGSISSPMLIYLDKFVPNISFITMIASAFLSAFLCLFLPETRGTIQPDTREDLRNLLQTKRLLSCTCKKVSSEESHTSHGENPGTVSGIVDGQENMAFERETPSLNSENISKVNENEGQENIALDEVE
ncbi:Solute carrier family 22 member 6-A [Holothuria leucospilota]|uniref:Solute carrier family 22 member 6-A n=1 Tax=Holothuria leucospilota TaxID=206669 RepID=A0A9Q1HGU3_HOLLE|nr:Solute carrier family 22 member 6-A [Holothuria leucospilota]